MTKLAEGAVLECGTLCSLLCWKHFLSPEVCQALVRARGVEAGG